MSELPVVTFLGPREEPEVLVGEVMDESIERQTATLKVSGEFLSRGGPRETLRRAVDARSEELAATVVDAALGDGSATKARLALDAISRSDPPLTGSASVRVPTTAAEVNALSMSELLQVAKAVGMAT